MTDIHQNDENTKFKALIVDSDTLLAIDISTATVKKMTFQKNDGTILTKDAAFTTDGTDGYIEYDTITGDKSLTGRLKIQGYVVDGAFKNYSSIEEVTVKANLYNY